MTDFTDDSSRQRPTPEEDPAAIADFNAAGDHTRELEAPKDFERHIGRLPSGPQSWSAGTADDDATQSIPGSQLPAPTPTYPRADPNFFNERATPRAQAEAAEEEGSEEKSREETRFDLLKRRVLDRIEDIGRTRVAAGAVLVVAAFISLCAWLFSSSPAPAQQPAPAPAAQVAAPTKSPTVATPSHSTSRPKRTLGGPMPHRKKHRHR